MTAKVSVIIPAFNATKTLAATIKSVSCQTFRNFEIIVVDDGSSDETLALLRLLQEAEPRLIVISQSNQGVAVARNNGIAASRSPYVAFLDADDLWHPTKLEKQVEALDRAPPDVGMIYCWSRLIDERDVVIASVTPLDMREWVFNQHVYVNPLGNGSGLLVRREVAIAVDGFDPSLRELKISGAEDLLFQLRIAAGWKAQLVPQFLVGYRMTDSNFSADKERMYRSVLHAISTASASVSGYSRAAVRWSRAAFLFDLIAYHTANRRTFKAVLRGLQALFGDPIMVLDRLAFALKKRVVVRTDSTVGQAFLRIDPLEKAHPVSSIMQKRLARLARLDRRFPRTTRFPQRSLKTIGE